MLGVRLGVACQVPSTTTTPGRVAAHARSRSSTGSAHLVGERGDDQVTIVIIEG